MLMKKIILLCVLSALSVAAFAQEESAAEPKPRKEKYPNEWYVGIGGGFNYSYDAGRYTTGFTGRGMGTSLDIYAGKWLNRAFGVRVGYHGLNTSANDKYEHDYGSHPFLYVHGDATFRPATWFVPYVHAGYANVSHKNYGVRKGSLAGGLGVTFPIRAGSVSFIPGLRFTMFNGDILDHEDVNTKSLRYKFSATLGIAYHWTTKRQRAKVETRYVDRTVHVEVPVEVLRVDTLVVKQVDTVYIREVKDRERDFNREMAGLVLFDINSSQIRPEAYPVLNDAALFLKENPHVTVIVEGHADITGNDRINQPLSERRARAVADYLIRRGIEEHRLTPIGYGSKRPKDTNETAEGRQMNRRMDFVFQYAE